MADDNLTNLPNQKDLEKEIADYLSRKYGGQVKIISTGFFPYPEKKGEKKQKISPPKKPTFHFDLKPEELAAYLDEYVIRQDDAKAILATKICTHFNRIRHESEKPRSQADQEQCPADRADRRRQDLSDQTHCPAYRCAFCQR
jgi:ATP-dependent Clp protease ATP-binding subunit ClpX